MPIRLLPRFPHSATRQLGGVALACLTLFGWHVHALAADKEKPPQAAATAKVEAALVKVDGAWIRPTVKGQTATGGFMTLMADKDLTLVGFSTKVAKVTELHDMVMDGDVMRMREIESLPLPAGQAVALKPGPGGKHLMLMALQQPLKSGDNILMTLKLRTAEGKIVTQDVTVPVNAGPMAQGQGGNAHQHDHKHDHHHNH